MSDLPDLGDLDTWNPLTPWRLLGIDHPLHLKDWIDPYGIIDYFMPDISNAKLLTLSDDSAPNRRVVYGKKRVGGFARYIEVTGDNNQYLHYIIAICEGPVQSIKLCLDGEEVTVNSSTHLVTTDDWMDGSSSKIFCKFYDGTQTDADSDLVSASAKWNANDKMLGIAYVYLRLQYHEEVFVNGVPKITFLVEGRTDIYDPRAGTSGYSANPALCWAHYMNSSTIGPQVPWSALDESYLIAASNKCDEGVALAAGGTEKRYSFNGVVQTAADTESTESLFLAAMAGTRTYTDGKFLVRAGGFEAPVKTLTAKNVMGNMVGTNTTKKSSRFNIVKGTFAGTLANYVETSYPSRDLGSDILTAEGELTKELNLTQVNSASQCERLAEIVLRKGRLMKTRTFDADITCLDLAPGDTILLYFPLTGDNYTIYEVQTVQPAVQDGVILVKLSLKETASTVWDWTTADEEEFTLDSVPESSISITIYEPQGLLLTAGTSITVDASGTGTASMTLLWSDIPDTYSSGKIEVQYAISGSAVWSSATSSLSATSTTYKVTGLATETQYDFRIRVIKDGVKSAWSSTATATTVSWDGSFVRSKVATPVFNPASELATDPDTVAITCATTGAVIRWSKSAAPVSITSGTEYTTGVSVNAGETLYARAFKDGFDDSSVASQTFTLAS